MSATLYQLDNAIATITLNRPEALNALNTALMQSLTAHMQQAADDPAVRCVIITGAGRGFSSGADLTTAKPPSDGSPIDLGEALRERYNPLIVLMRTMPKPIISAVNGVAAGAGMSIALAADIVLAGQSASFLQAFSKIGLVPDAGSTWFLPRLAGDIRARALAILADQISADDALRYGMVWKVLPDEELQAQANTMALKLASMPTKAYGLIKQALDQSSTNSLSTQLHLEANLQREAGLTHDFVEGVSAFLQKRKPQFQGR
jgi:2-(1,2-epoxy-1,2-dihydrophenyl)acetyl-CoA isomerase